MCVYDALHSRHAACAGGCDTAWYRSRIYCAAITALWSTAPPLVWFFAIKTGCSSSRIVAAAARSASYTTALSVRQKYWRRRSAHGPAPTLGCAGKLCKPPASAARRLQQAALCIDCAKAQAARARQRAGTMPRRLPTFCAVALSTQMRHRWLLPRTSSPRVRRAT